MFDKNHHVSGARPLDGTPDDSCFGNAAYVVGLVGGGVAPKGLPQACYDLMSNLETAAIKAVPNDAKGKRRAWGKALMAASETQCGSYRKFLTQFHGNVRSTFGISSQLAAIIATIATGNAAQWFAGAAAGLGGAGGTLKDSHFYDQTLPTLTQAFTLRRTKKEEEINKKLDDSEPSKYGRADVLHDVQKLHNDCSLGAGLEELAKSLKEAASPTPDIIKTFMTQQKEARDAMRNFIKEEAKKDLESAGTGTGTGADTGNGADTETGTNTGTGTGTDTGAGTGTDTDTDTDDTNTGD